MKYCLDKGECSKVALEEFTKVTSLITIKEVADATKVKEEASKDAESEKVKEAKADNTSKTPTEKVS